MEWFIATTTYFLVLGFALLYNHKISTINEEYDKDMERWYKKMTKKEE